MAPAVAEDTTPVVKDTSAPVIESFEISAASSEAIMGAINAHLGGTITATLQITDDSGLGATPEVTILDAAGDVYETADVAIEEGDVTTDGTWTATADIAANADVELDQLGEWDVQVGPVVDKGGYSTNGPEDRQFTYAIAPGAPANVDVQSAIVSNLTASWEAPESNGAAIEKYVGTIRDTAAEAGVDPVATFETESTNTNDVDVALEVGPLYELSVVAVNAAGESDAAVSEFQAENADLTSSTPTIEGLLYVDKTLTANVGDWGPESVDFTYQWIRDGKHIAGATGSEYALTAADKDAHISVQVTGNKAGYNPTTILSGETAAVSAADADAPDVTASLEAGMHIYGSEIALSADENAKIYYTTDGTEPTEESALYEKPIAIEGWFELKYIAVDGAENTSDVAGGTYTLEFTDVDEETKYQEAIQWLVKAGVTNGYKEDGVFKPYTAINRDAMAAFMYRLAGEPEFEAPAESPFVDYDADNMFYKEVTWLHTNKISEGWTSGDDDTTAEYRPFTPINRDAMAAFMFRFAALEGDRFVGPAEGYEGPADSPFVDYNADNMFYAEVSWLAEQGISTGWKVDEAGTHAEYRPFTPINRDAMAIFLQRLADEVPAEEAPADNG